MAAPAGRMERARREALRFAREARHLARRHRRELGEAGEEVATAAAEVEAAARAEEPDRLSAALQALDRLWDEHLAPQQKRLWRTLLEVAVAAALVSLAVRLLALDSARVRSASMEPMLLPGDVLLVNKLAYAVRIPFTHRRLFDRASPRRGDLVVFDDPRQPGRVEVKRVVGVEGDVVELREQVLQVNGVPQPRSLLGEYALAEPARAGNPGGASICRRYRESLAKGVLEPPDADEQGSDGAGRWDEAAGAGVAGYDVLQCRQPHPAGQEGPFAAVAPGHVFVLGDNRDRSADSRGLGGWQLPYGHIRGRAFLVLWSWGEGGWWPGGPKGLRLERLFKDVTSR
ncbi:MAG TPA: signal peptidase I [Anaeromyxobacter sp.]|nr:signal peptidase I [Anaeromyxobacter sp.]